MSTSKEHKTFTHMRLSLISVTGKNSQIYAFVYKGHSPYSNPTLDDVFHVNNHKTEISQVLIIMDRLKMIQMKWFNIEAEI